MRHGITGCSETAARDTIALDTGYDRLDRYDFDTTSNSSFQVFACTARGGDDQRSNLLFEERSGDSDLDRWVTRCMSEKGDIARLAEGCFNPSRDEREERVGRIGDDEANDVASAVLEIRRHDINNVTQLVDGLQDALRCVFRRSSRNAPEYTRDRRLRGARAPRHVVHGRFLSAHRHPNSPVTVFVNT